jgi:hypothetical protein
MKAKTFLFVLFVATTSATTTWLAARHQLVPKAAASATVSGRKILYYQSPMHPWIKSDKPGKCPICGMDLVPVYADENGTPDPSVVRKIKFYQSSMNPKETSPTPAKDSMGMDMTPVYESAEGTNTGYGLKLNADSVNVANIRTVLVGRRQIVRTLHVAGDISVNSWTEAWFEFDAYERDIPWLKIGQTIEVSVPSIPGKIFTAEIKLHGLQLYADQNFDMASDSTKVRAEISNGPVEFGDFGPRKLFSGLYAEGCVLVNAPDVLAVPRSAVLQPGSQPVVYVDDGKGYYEPRKIKLGRMGDDYAEVLDGLQEGEKVVTSGNLLIDAEAQISQSN